MRRLVLLALLASAACTKKSQPTSEVTLPSSPSASVTVSSSASPMTPLADPDLRVVVDARDGGSFYLFSPKPASFFTPTDREIGDLEAKLPVFLRTAPEAARSMSGTPLAARAMTYRRQYVGIVDASGTRRIWGNYFCGDFGDNKGTWRMRVVLVKDGGDCYFNVKFDPASGTFSELRVNGEA